MTQSLSSVLGARIIYHSDPSDLKKKIALSVVGFVALTSLVIGILALLHSFGIVNISGLGVIPQAAVFSMVVGGGVLLIANCIALVALAFLNKRVKQQMKEALKVDTKTYPEGCQSKDLFDLFDLCPYFQGRPLFSEGTIRKETAVYLLAELVNKKKTLHAFQNESQRDDFAKKIWNSGSRKIA